MNKLYHKLWQILPCSGRKKKNKAFINHINHCGILFKWRAATFPQPRTSIASRFQCGRKIKVQIQLLFGVADLWVLCLICVTLIEVSKEIASGSCTKGNHHMFTRLRREAAIKTNWVFHLGSNEKVLSGQELPQAPLFHLAVSNYGAVMKDWYLSTFWQIGWAETADKDRKTSKSILCAYLKMAAVTVWLVYKKEENCIQIKPEFNGCFIFKLL